MNNQGETERNRLVVERRKCRHCNKSLSLKTYKAHKRRFYDSANDIWFTKESMTLQPEMILVIMNHHLPCLKWITNQWMKATAISLHHLQH